MKKLLKGLCLCLMMAVGFGIMQYAPVSHNAYADTTATESAYAKVSIADMVGYASDSATRDAATGNITNVANYGRFGFGPKYENVEITSTVRFTTVGNTTFTLRAKGEGLMPAGSWSDNQGYMVRWYPSGQFDFVKNGVKVGETFFGPLPAVTVDTDYTVVFKTVNMSDGSVQVLLTINDLTVVNHNDPVDDNDTPDDTADDILPITGAGWYAMTSEGSVFSVSGTKKTVPIVNLSDVSTAVTSSNFAGATVDENGVVTSKGTGSGGYSGVGYYFYNDGQGYGYKANVTPKAVAGYLVFSIGAYKTNSHEMNRPNTATSSGSSGWSWDDHGYVIYWYNYGQLHLARGEVEKTRKTYVNNSNYKFVADKTYAIEYSMLPFDDGSARVVFKVDGKTVIDFLDIPVYDAEGNETYTPAKLVHGTSHLNKITYALNMSVNVEATFAPIDPISVDQKTVITSDLGTAVSDSASAQFDRNGAVSLLKGALPVGWNANIKNSVIRFNTTFTSKGSSNPNIVFLINYKGANLDQPNGGDWATKGYAFRLYSNGMTSLLDGGKALFDGWNPYAYPGVSLVLDTNFLFEIGTITDEATYTRVWLKINDKYVFNYLDTTSPVVDGGWFSVYNGGSYVGNMMPYGVEYPVVTTDIIDGEKAGINAPVTLGYTLTGATDSDNVTYFVDEEKSTATANISGNVVTPLTEGNLVVYACVNGIYSEDIAFEVEQKAYPVVINLPTTPIIVGGEKVSIDGKMSDDSQVTSKSFRIENISGRATINATTGEITPIAAGTIRVYATINGVESEGYILTIIPQIEIRNATTMAKGGTLDNLGYIANCDLPNEIITATYELVEGSQYVELNPTTGSVRALEIGIFGVRVTLTGETFQAVSPVCRISIEEPIIVINDGPVRDMYVGQEMLLYPHISQGGVTITEVDLVVTLGDKLISTQVVEQGGKKYVKITAVAAGTVRVKPKINGVEGVQESEFAITLLTPTIIVNNVCVGRSQTLSVMFNSNDFEYSNIVYSIVEGQDVATLDGAVLTGTKVGSVTIKAVIDGKYTAQATVQITDKVIFKGIVDGQDILVGSKVQLDYYVYDQEGVVESVEYVLVDGHLYATMTEDGLLIAKKIGTIKVQVIVDGVKSNVLTLHIYQNTSKLVGYIVLGSFLLVGVVSGSAAGIVFGVKRFKLKKAAAQGDVQKTEKTAKKQNKKSAEKSQPKQDQPVENKKELKQETKVEEQAKTEEVKEEKQPSKEESKPSKQAKNTSSKQKANDKKSQEKSSTKNTNNTQKKNKSKGSN